MYCVVFLLGHTHAGLKRKQKMGDGIYYMVHLLSSLFTKLSCLSK